MNDKIENLKNIDPYEAIGGADMQGRDVILDGRKIPKLHMHNGDGEIHFVLDRRLMYSFPKELAAHAARFAANAMAIGAGYAHYTMDDKVKQFAVRCGPLEDAFPGVELGSDSDTHAKHGDKGTLGSASGE